VIKEQKNLMLKATKDIKLSEKKRQRQL